MNTLYSRMQKQFLIQMRIGISILISCSDQKKFIFYEQFDTNQFGWYEESTYAHDLKIENGHYIITSWDSSYRRTSAGTFEDDYLTGLPNQYEIELAFVHDPLTTTSSYFGFILESPSIEYEFQVCLNGQIQVCEYDYNLKKPLRPFNTTTDINIESPIVLNVRIENREFEITVNGNTLGNGKFRCGTKAWKDFRVVTSSETSTLIDYIKIQ